MFFNTMFVLAGVVGFEPTDAGVKVLCLATWLHPYIIGPFKVLPVTELEGLKFIPFVNFSNTHRQYFPSIFYINKTTNSTKNLELLFCCNCLSVYNLTYA